MDGSLCKYVVDDEKPYQCTQEGCDYKAKKKWNLTQHLADVHDIGVVWHYCEDCSFIAKQRSTVTRHINRWHSA